jgi:hypothetical protein
MPLHVLANDGHHHGATNNSEEMFNQYRIHVLSCKD